MMERIIRPDGLLPAADMRRPHERWPEKYVPVPGEPGTYRYVPAKKET